MMVDKGMSCSNIHVVLKIVINNFTFSTSLTIVFSVRTPSGLSQLDSFIDTQPRLMKTVVLSEVEMTWLLKRRGYGSSMRMHKIQIMKFVKLALHGQTGVKAVE